MSRNKQSSSKKTYDVYVGRVPRTIDENAIGSVFSKFGQISDVLYRVNTNGPYGFAIVKFKDQKAAAKALEQDTVDVFGNMTEVKNAFRSNQNVENGYGAGPAHVMKMVTFAEPPCIPIPPPTDKVRMQPYYDHSFSDNIYGTFCHNGDGNHHEIMCVNVENAVTFHGCPMNRWKDLESLSMKLNSICPNLVRVLRAPATNKVYGALFTADGAWYRCAVIQNSIPSKRGMCIVSYIDYGNIAEVSCTDMVELPEPLKAVRPFAVKCVFSNLMCSPKALSGVTYLHHLIMKRMSLYAVPSVNNVEFHVIKCSCNGIDVIAELLRNGYALHKMQVANETSPLPRRSDKGSNSKPQPNKQKKGSGGKQHKNLANGCNDTFRSCSEVNNNSEKACDNASGCRNSSSDESQHDFMPKKIIRRGRDAVGMPSLDETKSVNHLLKIDNAISNVKLVNKIRSLVPLHTDDDLINNAVKLLQTEVNEAETAEANKKVIEVRQKYYEALKEIKECSNQEMLLDLKKKRDELRMNLIKVIEEFLNSFDVSLLAEKKEIQEIITALGSNSNACMDIFLAESPKTVEALLDEYNTKKEIKKNVIQKARENTNKKYENFQALLSDLQKEFTLNMVDGNMDETYLNSASGKRGSWALKFEESLTEYSIALEEERNTSTMIKDTSQESIIDCILKKLDVPKEKIDAECDLFETYKSLYCDLKNTSDLSSTFEELYALKKTVEEISSNCIVNGDVGKADNILMELHNTLLKEDALLATLARASVFHFPEFVLEHPNLRLQDYQDCYLLKNSWDVKFFPLFSNCNRIEPSFVSKLADEFVIIKEFEVDSKESYKELIVKALTWNETKSSCLVKIKGLFKRKEENILYGVIPTIWETLFDNPLNVPVNFRKASNLLQKILEGLRDLHSRGIVHGAIHPLAILHKDDGVLLDFSCDRKYLKDKLCLKGINFKAAGDMHSSADMYGFGCLVLWVLFPNLSFNSTEQGTPNIQAFQSIIQEVLSIKDYASLSALLNVNQDLRPPSRRLLSNKFLKDLRIMSEAVP